MKISALRITPVAIKDPPLLNSTGVHQPYALRTVIELETDTAHIGLSESHGGSEMLRSLEAAKEAVIGLDPFDLNSLMARLKKVVANTADAGLPLAPGTHGDKLFMRVFGALEVACLDLQGKALDKPVVDVLGGAVRERVPYSAYLFFKFERHKDSPGYAPDPWGEVLTPEAVVEEARAMIEAHGFGSIKLKGGVLEPALEVEAMKLLREAFPAHPLRIDPNAAWTVETSIEVGKGLNGTLEYLEDPTPGLTGMAAVAREVSMPLATNMVVTKFNDLPEAINRGSVGVVLSDHHYWGGLRASQHLAAICATWGLGLSMHSNSHLGISLAAMTHLALNVPNLTYACDTHYPWQEEDVLEGGRLRFEEGALTVPEGPGLGVTLDRDALEKLHRQYLRCGFEDRDDKGEMRKYEPDWVGALPRF